VPNPANQRLLPGATGDAVWRPELHASKRVVCAAKRTLHLIVNNYAAHKHPKVLHWLAHPKGRYLDKRSRQIDAVKRGTKPVMTLDDARR
jgi:hypothetical protein